MKCDICGVDVKCFDRRYVVKSKANWLDFLGRNKNYIYLDVCEDCINKICKAYEKGKCNE